MIGRGSEQGPARRVKVSRRSIRGQKKSGPKYQSLAEVHPGCVLHVWHMLKFGRPWRRADVTDRYRANGSPNVCSRRVALVLLIPFGE